MRPYAVLQDRDSTDHKRDTGHVLPTGLPGEPGERIVHVKGRTWARAPESTPGVSRFSPATALRCMTFCPLPPVACRLSRQADSSRAMMSSSDRGMRRVVSGLGDVFLLMPCSVI